MCSGREVYKKVFYFICDQMMMKRMKEMKGMRFQ